MAKKTSASKGYRKQENKKPFLTKKELIALIIILVVVVAAFLIINWYPTRNFLRASAVKPGDITSYAKQEDGSRLKNFFVKLGEVNEFEGYTMEVTPSGGANQNYSFYPVEESNVEHFEIRGGFGSAALLTDSILAAESETMPFYDVVETTINGVPAFVYSYTSSSYVAPEGEEAKGDEEHNSFTQNLSAYVACGEDHAIGLHIFVKGDSADCFVPEEEMVDFVSSFAGAFTVYTEAE
ncbi:MAG: hypothetical protein IJA26_07345 [Clostridia bacterium]|nr:hypothetical protein [Clostridia bacterium]